MPNPLNGRSWLPHNWDAERALLGGVMLAPERLSSVRQTIRAEDFHRPSHQHLFTLVVALADAGIVPDLLAVIDEVDRHGAVNVYGGVDYVCGMPKACASVDHIDTIARCVKSHAVRRRLVLAARQVESDIYEAEHDLTAAVRSIEEAVAELVEWRL